MPTLFFTFLNFAKADIRLSFIKIFAPPQNFFLFDKENIIET